MHRLRNVKLTEAQLEWLLWTVDFETYLGWKHHYTTPGLVYTENSELRIQVTQDVKRQEFTIWTWENEEENEEENDNKPERNNVEY